MSKRYWHFVVIVFVAFSYATTAFAGEVRIVDERGLIKAAKRTNSTVSVAVQFQGPPGVLQEMPVLSNADGLHPEIQGQLERSGKFVFKNVKEGTWKMKWIGASVPIASISIGEN